MTSNTLFFIVLFAGMLILTNPAAAEIPFNESVPGDRNIGQPFTWIAYNVSMNADNTYHYSVYDYREIGTGYHFYSVSWGQWMVQDAEPGMKFFAVWIRGWLEGTAWHGWGSDSFRLWVGNRSYRADPVLLQDLPLRNIGKSISTDVSVLPACQQTVEPIDTVNTASGGVMNTGRYLPVVISELESLKARNERGLLTTERYGWKDEHEMIRMDPGTSNAFDGVLIFQVPEAARPEEMAVSGSFWSWGTAWWYLTNVTIVQDSTERNRQLELVLLDLQREQGVRLPDREYKRVMA